MTQRVRDGLGLPAGLYRMSTGANPTFFVPNGITADQISSLVYANVIPVTGGYDAIEYDADSGVFLPRGNPNPSPTSFNSDVAAFFDDVLHQIFFSAHPDEDFPYAIIPSETRANIVDDITTLKADFSLV